MVAERHQTIVAGPGADVALLVGGGSVRGLEGSSAIVGRDDEAKALRRWVGGGRPALLEIVGEAGLGKTTLWEEGLRLAREAGSLVIECRPVEVEISVAYGGLASLLEPVLDLVRDELPRPRLHALEAALRLREVRNSGLDETAVALGALSAVRAVAELRPVLLALEDVQWLDASSRVALTYALRHLREGDDVGVLVTRRVGAGDGPLDLRGSVVAATAAPLRLGPLSLGALHRIVATRLGTPLSRPRLVHVHAASQGNPLHALELARAMAGVGPEEAALAIPASLHDVLRERIEALPSGTRRLLLHVAAAGDPSPELLVRIGGVADVDLALDDGIHADVLVLVNGRVRFSHPLLGSVAYRDATEPERRRAHLRLAELAASREEQARHLALAGTGPDEAVAAALEQAAEAACRSGARGTGARLYEQAARLTPSEERSASARRLVSAAGAHLMGGEPDRARILLEGVSARSGPERFEALCALGTLLDETEGGDAAFAAFEGSLETDDPVVAARAHRGLAQSLVYVGDLERALAHAEAAVATVDKLDARESLVYGLAMLALVRKLAGLPSWREPLDRGLTLEAELELPQLDGCPSAFQADAHRIGFELDEARHAYERMLARATERGDVQTESWCQLGLATVEIHAGRWEAAAVHKRELFDLAEQTAFLHLPALRTEAHLAFLRGDVDRARGMLGELVVEADAKGESLNLRSALHLQGLLELSLGDPTAALAPLRNARLIAERIALGEPGMLLSYLDEVEARAATDDPESAAMVLEAFQQRTARSLAPWIEPLVDRARGLLLAAERDPDGACAILEAAVAAEDRLPLPLERARSWLALGRVLRRAHRRAEAQGALGQALALFEELGAPLWAERVREELRRIGGRTPASDELTATERQIATKVAEGLTNREVASTLFVSPKTVESTLTRVYRKLGVRSRTELTRQITRSPESKL